MTPTDHYGHWIGLIFLILGVGTWLFWRAKWRRDDRRARAVVAGIADERRISLMEPDPTPYEDEPEEITEEIQLDEPVTRIYVEPGYTMFRGGLVHTDCVTARLRDGTSCAGCAVHLDHVLTGAS
jgi:hypothetical protein